VACDCNQRADDPVHDEFVHTATGSAQRRIYTGRYFWELRQSAMSKLTLSIAASDTADTTPASVTAGRIAG
jgi:hypothetical protein